MSAPDRTGVEPWDVEKAAELASEALAYLSRQYNARKREENRREWCGYFERLVTCLRARAEEYDHRAQVLMEDQPKGA